MRLSDWLDGVRQRLFPQWASRSMRRRRLLRARRGYAPWPVAACVDALEERVLLSVFSGTETLVNATVAGDQRFFTETDRSFTVTPDGGVFVAWSSTTSASKGKTSETIVARRLNAQGQPVGAEFQVSSGSCESARNAVVGVAGPDRIVVIWQATGDPLDKSGAGVFGRIYSSAGTPLTGEFRISQTTSGDQTAPSVVMLPSSSFAVVWTSTTSPSRNKSSSSDVYVRTFNSSGQALTSEARVSSTTTGNQQDPTIVSLSTGGFIVAWSGSGAGDSAGIFARIFDAKGKPIANEFLVNGSTAGTQSHPAIAVLGTEGIVITWEATGCSLDTGGAGIFARLFALDGKAKGNESLVNDQIAGDQKDPSVAWLPGNGFVVAWNGAGFGDADGVFVREFETNGTPRGPSQRVNTTMPGKQAYPTVRARGTGYVVSWSGAGAGDSSGVFIQAFQTGDSVAPTLAARLASDTGGSSSDKLTRDPTVTGTATDNVGVTLLEAALDSGNGTPVFQNITQKLVGGVFTLTSADLAGLLVTPGPEIAPLVAPALPDGDYRLSVRARDNTGNVSPVILLTFTLDTLVAPPTAALQNDTGTNSTDRLTADPTVTGTAADPHGIAALEAAFDTGGPLVFQNITSKLVNGAFTLTAGDLASILGGALADGNYKLNVRATDGAGNVSAITLLTFILDTQIAVPQVALQHDTGASATDRITNDPTLTGTATDPNGVVKLEAALDHGTGAPAFKDITAKLVNGQFTLATADLAGLLGAALADGDYRFSLRKTDGAGNVSGVRELTFRLDTTPPAITLDLAPESDTGTPDDRVTELEVVTLTGLTEAGLAVVLTPGAQSTTASGAGQYSFGGLNLAAGDNAFQAQATDLAGNVGTATATITRETGEECPFENLAGWVVSQTGGTQSGQGTVVAQNCSAVLREGDSFTVALARTFVVTANAKALDLAFDSPQFDLTDPSFVNDAFEVALLDADGKPLVLPYVSSRDSFFNLTEGEPTALGANALVSSGLIQLDLSHIPAGTTVKLVIRLVNNDSDTGTSVRITDFQIVSGSLSTPDGVAFPATAAPDALSRDDLERLLDVTSDVGQAYGATSLNAGDGVLFTDVTLTNIGNATLRGPLVAVIDQISDPTVAVTNPDGFTPDGRPYFNFGASIPGGTLTPGETTASRTFAFANPRGAQFTFHVSAFTLPNSTPTVAAIPSLDALVGQPFAYQVDAADADGDGLAFSIVTGPRAMTIDAAGRIQWTPTANDIGTQQVRILIDDGAGGKVERSFTIEVRSNVPNRPPVITSSPVTDAAVAFSFDITDYDVGRGPVGVAIGNFTGNGQTIVTANELNQSVSLADYVSSSTVPPARTTILGEPPPRFDQLFEQGYNLDVGFQFNRGQSVQGVTAADFNGDGVTDLAVAIHSDTAFRYQEGVSVLLGVGDGTYQPPRVIFSVEYSSPGNGFTSILARDFDGDHVLDLLVAENGPKNLVFFKGHGNGTFDAPLRSATLRRPSHLHAADLDGDDDLDVVIGSEDGNGWQAEVLLNKGDGTFGAPTAFNTFPGSYLPDIQLADVDGIHGADLIIGNWSNNRVEIRLNDGDGQFGDPLLVTLLSGASAITPGDFNEDGKLDLHVGHVFGEVATYLGNGDGTFITPPDPSPLVSRLGFQPNHSYADGGNTAIDLNGDGNLDVYYASRGNNVLVVGFGRGDGSFDYEFMFAQPASDDPTRPPEGGGFSSPLVLDANGDGVPDIATASFAIDSGRLGKLSIILGDTPGSFRTTKIITAPNVGGIQAVGFADVNNDGAPDILQIGPPIATAINNADGTFADSQRAVGSFSGPGEFFGNQVVTADFDGDGNQDAFFYGTDGVQGGPPPRLILSLGLGNGLYQTPTIFGTGAFAIGASDLNGDDRPDAIAINSGGIGKRIELWINNGSGTGFTLLADAGHRLEYPATNSHSGFVIDDFDGDGIGDLVAHSTAGDSNSPPEQFMFFKGRAAANPTDVSDLFDAPVITTPGFRALRKMVAADLDHDGNKDLLALRDIGGFYVLIGNGDGTFAAPVFYGHGQDNITVADFDADGNLDVGLSNTFYAPTFLRGHGDGTFGRAEYYASFQLTSNYNIDSADVDGDRAADFLFTSGNDAGAFRGNAVLMSRRPGIQAVATGDLNGDGNLDALAVDYGLGHLTPLLGDGAGGIERQADLIVGRGPVALTIADLNDDQRDDIVSVNRAANSISVLIATAGGQFTRTDLATGQRPAAIAIQDLTGDNLPDLVVANSDETSISFFKNLGNGLFAPGVEIAVGIMPDSIAIGDVNGDTRPDIIAGSSENPAFVAVLNLALDTFVAQTAVPTGASLGGLALGDLTGDGRPDLVVTNPTEGRVSLYVGLGAAKFARPQPIGFDHAPTDVTLADMNGDGQLDIVTVNSDSDTATVIISRFNPASTYRYQVTAADPDGDAVAFELLTGPDGMTIDAAGQITWSATPDQIGVHPVTVVARDGRGGSATQSFVVEVSSQNGNSNPTFVTQPVVNALSTTDYHYSARAADGDQDPVRYELTNAPDGMTIDRNTGDISWGDPVGRGLTFNGRDDMVVVGASPALNFGDEFTYEVWVKFDVTPLDAGHWAFLVGSTNQTEMSLVGREWAGAPRFVFNVFGRPAVSNTIIEADKWYHVVATYKFGQNTQLYVNGVLDSGAGVADLTQRPPETFLTIGNTPGDGNREQGLVGSLDMVRVFNTTLTAQQAANEFRRAGPEAPGLIGDWQFNELDGPLAIDQSANGNDGTLAAPYAGRRMRTTFDDRVTPGGRSGDYPIVVRAVDGRGGASEQSFTLLVTADTPATLAGRVFNDQNADEQSAGDPGLAGWTVYLDIDRNGTREAFEPSTTTDTQGQYSFANLTPGAYRVAIEGRSGFRLTSPTDGDADVNLAAAQQLFGADFGVTTLNAPQGARGPAFVSTAPASGQVGELYVYQTQVRNSDGRPLAFDVLVAPEGLAINAETGGIGWLPATSQSGNHRVLIRVKDDRGLVDIQDFTIAIASAPTAPVISSQPGLAAFQGLPYRYAARAQDAEGGPLVFSLAIAPAGMTVDPNTGVVSWEPTALQNGPNHVELVVTDSTGLTGHQEFDVVVSVPTANHDPQIVSTPRTVAGLQRPYRYQVVADDDDGDPLDYALVAPPAGMTIDATGLVMWTPDQLNDVSVEVVVSDGRGGSDSQTFTLHVTSQLTNSLPRFTTAPTDVAAAGNLFAYDPGVVDPDGDPVQYLLDQGPTGLSIDPVTGALRWQIAADTRGDFAIQLRAIDPYGGEAVQAFTLAVRSPHEPPAITSTPPTEAAASVEYRYDVVAADPFGRALTYSLPTPPAGMTIDAATGAIRWTPTVGQIGVQSVVVQVANEDGAAATQGFDIVVTSGARNRPPVISSLAPETATVGVPYQYDVVAADPEGLALHYELRSGPASMQIDSGTGRITWTPVAGDLGTVAVTVAALDPANAAGVQTFLLTVLGVNHDPVIQSTAPDKPVSGGAVFRYTVAATDADFDALKFTLDQGPAGMTIDGFGRITWATTPADVGPHPVNVLVSDGRGGSINQSFVINVVSDTTAPRVTVVPASNLVYAFNSAVIRVSATDDVGVAALSLTMDGQPVPLDNQGVAVIPFPATGRISTFVATAVDRSGNVSTASNTVRFYNSAEVSTYPQVAIHSPADAGVVTGFTDVVGTVADDNLREWRLLVRREDGTDDDFVEIARGTTTIDNDVLGRFDPTLLKNDSYVLRLVAVDNTGFEAFTDTHIGVSGHFKLGNFSVSFSDFTVPVAGIPITVTRTYDTLTASEQRDLGYGWRLEFRNTDLRTSLPKTGLEQSGIFSAFRAGTKVYVTLPGGQREGFTFTPDVRVLPGFGGSLVVATPRFTPDPGVRDTLSVRGGTFLVNDAGELIGSSGQPYNPTAEDFGGGYTLTTRDGTAYRIDGLTGLLLSATDLNGNTVSFSDAGVTSSTGVGITFQRDAQGRIVAAKDPAGNSVRYTYNAAGELATVTDRLGNTTRYTYLATPAHYLDQVIDPLGRTGVRVDYESNGRFGSLANGQNTPTTFDFNTDIETVVSTDGLGNLTTIAYDNRGNVVARTDALGHTTTMAYDASNQLIALTNPLGQTQHFTWDAAGNMVTSTDALGHTTRWTYDSAGRVLTMTDPLGNTETNAYDDRGNLVKSVDAAGGVTTALYDTAGNRTAITDALGNTTLYGYSNAGFLTSFVKPNGLSSAMTVDPLGNVTRDVASVPTASGPVSVTYEYTYDANGELMDISGPGGSAVSLGYDAARQFTRSTDVLGNQTTLAWSSDGQQSGATIPGVGTITLTFDAAGRNTGGTIPGLGNVQYVYDDAGRRTSTILPDGTVNTTTYDDAGRVTGSTNAGFSGGSRVYDAAGHIIAITSPDGITTHYERDAAGRVVAEIDAAGNRTEFTYDALGRVMATRLSTGQTLTIVYDALGNIIAATDIRGGISTYTWNSSRLPTSATDPSGSTFTFTTNGYGGVDQVTDPLNRLTTFTYDTTGRVTGITSPTGLTYSVIYDALGRVSQFVDGLGRTVTMTYTTDGRILTRSTGASDTESFTYDSNRQLVRVDGPSGATVYERDSLGHLTGTTGVNGIATDLGLDALGRATSVSTSAGTTTRVLSAGGRITSVTDRDGRVTTTQYDALGRPAVITGPDGRTETRTYDSLDQILSIEYRNSGGTLIRGWTYTRNSSGNIASIQDSNGRRTDYRYDASGRLIEERVTENGSTSQMNYSYDAAGNVSAITNGSGTRAFSVDAEDRLLSDGEWTYSWNAAGVMTGRSRAGQTDTFEYDSHDRLVRVVRSGAVNSVIQYTYDADGLLARRTEGASVVQYVWDRSTALPQLLEERDGNGALLRRYESDGGMVVRFTDAAGNRFRLLTDHLGTVRGVMNESGAIVGTQTFDAFGRLLGAPASTLGFTNGITDAATGFVFLRSRWYNPSAARFISRDSATPDPAAAAATWNRYTYCANDPINRADPSGQFTLPEQLTTTKILGILTASFFVFGGLSVYQSGGMSAFGSWYPALGGAWFNGTTTSFSASFGNSWGPLAFSFGGGLELLNNSSSGEAALFLFVGPSFNPIGGSGPSGSLGLGESLVFDTPTASDYTGWFWSVTASAGFMQRQIQVAMSATGTLTAVDKIISQGALNITFAWSPAPTFWSRKTESPTQEPSVIARYPGNLLQPRHSHTWGVSASDEYTRGVTLSVTYYFALAILGSEDTGLLGI